MNNAIELKNLTLSHRKNIILNNISGVFPKGTLTAIAGPNGAGKSTLIKGIVGLIKPSQGHILIDPKLRKHMSLLPQASDLDLSFPITTFDLVAMGAWKKTGLWHSYSSEDKNRIFDALSQVGLSHKADDLIGALSGGQLQRALFARLMVSQAQIMILDEPFAAVDEETCQDLMALIKHWHEQGRTIIVVLHDVNLVRQKFEQALLLAHQVVAWGPVAEVMTDDNIEKARRLSLGGF
ncbi:metal ABC transporter ATP-binding protein [Brackiella oedipodis]|uniref:metal ABC transporter ATP-binding protein n=1 Tax=Brackiella oedipodis TaxID=124225 RepID=UPI000A56B5BD|nr:metal ABC transporter ATP-binding protein [Brackiella oedipodis]